MTKTRLEEITDTLARILDELRAETSAGHASLPSLAEIEGFYVRHVLRETRGNKSAASRILGVDRKTLMRMIRRHRINLPF